MSKSYVNAFSFLDERSETFSYKGTSKWFGSFPSVRTLYVSRLWNQKSQRLLAGFFDAHYDILTIYHFPNFHLSILISRLLHMSPVLPDVKYGSLSRYVSIFSYILKSKIKCSKLHVSSISSTIWLFFWFLQKRYNKTPIYNILSFSCFKVWIEAVILLDDS